MIRVEIDWDLCQACYPCTALKACNVRAIVKIAPDEPAYIEVARCHGCGKCVPACSFAAIRPLDIQHIYLQRDLGD